MHRPARKRSESRDGVWLQVLDLVNDGAVILVVLSFLVLVGLGAPQAHLDYLLASVRATSRRQD